MTNSHDRIARRAHEIFLAGGERHGQDWADWFQAELDMRSADTAAQLTCAVLGHVRGAEPLIGGSGVFVAPGLAITARHVIEELNRTIPEHADRLRDRAAGLVEMPHNAALFQMTDAAKDSAPAATWSVTNAWYGPFADLALMESVPDNQFGHEMKVRIAPLFAEWSLLPPPLGAQVVMFGVPSASLTTSDAGWTFRGPYTSYSSEVLEVFDAWHDRGMLNFPGFFVRGTIDHGFSGGPVFWNGRLCGVACAVLGDKTYVASLWPFGLMPLKKTQNTEHLADWFDAGRIHAPDWPAVRNRISLRRDDRGAIVAHIDPA